MDISVWPIWVLWSRHTSIQKSCSLYPKYPEWTPRPAYIKTKQQGEVNSVQNQKGSMQGCVTLMTGTPPAWWPAGCSQTSHPAQGTRVPAGSPEQEWEVSLQTALPHRPHSSHQATLSPASVPLTRFRNRKGLPLPVGDRITQSPHLDPHPHIRARRRLRKGTLAQQAAARLYAMFL